jgi:hypothetical protein
MLVVVYGARALNTNVGIDATVREPPHAVMNHEKPFAKVHDGMITIDLF